MIAVSEILDRVLYMYNDVDYDRFDEATYLRFISDALNQILLVRPDCHAVTQEHVLVKGVQQLIPDDGFRLIDILYNLDVNSNPTTAVMNVPKGDLDAINLAWPSVASSDSVSNFAHDPSNPKVFWVVPSANAGTKISIVYSKAFPDITDKAQVIDIDIIFKDSIVYAVLAMLYASETESDVSIAHLQTFTNLLSTLLNTELQQGVNVGPREDK